MMLDEYSLRGNPRNRRIRGHGHGRTIAHWLESHNTKSHKSRFRLTSPEQVFIVGATSVRAFWE